MEYTPDLNFFALPVLMFAGSDIQISSFCFFLTGQPQFYVSSGVFLCFFLWFLFCLSKCYSLTTHGREDGRTVGGVSVKTQIPKIGSECHCPSRSSTYPHPVPCRIMLLCVCSWFCIFWVTECVFLRSLCQCVCSSNTGFSLTIPHLLPSFLSPLLMVTPPLLLPNQTFFFKTIILDFLPFLALHLSCYSPTLKHSNAYIHT